MLLKRHNYRYQQHRLLSLTFSQYLLIGKPRFLQDIERRLLALGSCLLEFGADVVEAAQLPLSAAVGNDEPICAQYHPSNVTLNPEQQAVFDTVMQHITRVNPSHLQVIHLEAAAGSGKTFLCLCLAMAVREKPGGSARCTAFTAKAARNYPGGHTAHFEFELNVTSISESPTTRLVSSGTMKSHGKRFSLTSSCHSLIAYICF
jgi:PIF1-like helicase